MSQQPGIILLAAAVQLTRVQGVHRAARQVPAVRHAVGEKIKYHTEIGSVKPALIDGFETLSAGGAPNGILSSRWRRHCGHRQSV